MLKIDTVQTIQGYSTPMFYVIDKTGRKLGLGFTSTADNDGWVSPYHKRYARNVELCEALGRLTGLPVKWPVCHYGQACSSHGPREAKRLHQSRRSWR